MADEEEPQVQEELAQWAEVQKRTFTRWFNVHLAKRGLKVENLSSDLSDGIMLINLLEEISGKKIPKYQKVVKMRIHKTENVSTAMDFMRQQGLKFTNVGATDIVDKKTKLILGVVWTIILRYQIQKIEHSGDSGKSVNAELLDWVNKAIPSYKIRNFSTDWKDGKAICALADYLKPGIIDVNLLDKRSPLDNAADAIQAAEVNLQIPPIMDAADMVIDEPDDLSVMTYLSYFRDYDLKHKLADPSQTTAEGPGLEGGVIGDENPFWVFPRNSFGDPARLEGAPFNVKVSGPGGENKDIAVDISKNDDGTFTVNYNLPTDTEEGTYNIDVNLNGEPINGSPFKVDFYKVDPVVLELAKGTTVDLSNLDKETSTPDGDKVFTVTPNGKLPDGAHYQVDIKGTNGESIPTEVTPRDDGAYDVKFYPTKDGKHNITVKLLDQNGKAARAKNSPFKPHVALPVFKYPRIVFPNYPNLGEHAKIVSSDKQPESVKHVLSNLPKGWKYHINIKLVDPDGNHHDLEGSPFDMEAPQKH
jgi:filamin